MRALQPAAPSAVQAARPPVLAAYARTHRGTTPFQLYDLCASRARACTCLLSAFKTGKPVLWLDSSCTRLCRRLGMPPGKTHPVLIRPELPATSLLVWIRPLPEPLMSAPLVLRFTFISALSSSSSRRREEDDGGKKERQGRRRLPTMMAPALISKQNKPVFSRGLIPAPITSHLIGLMRQTRCPRCIFNDLLISSFIFSYQLLSHF